MSWLGDFFFRAGKGVLRQRAQSALAPGAWTALPTAGVDFEGASGTLDGVEYVCNKTGVGSWAWQATGGGGGGTPGGADTEIQYNDGGSAFGGDPGLTYDVTTQTVAALMASDTDTDTSRVVFRRTNAAGDEHPEFGVFGRLEWEARNLDGEWFQAAYMDVYAADVVGTEGTPTGFQFRTNKGSSLLADGPVFSMDGANGNITFNGAGSVNLTGTTQVNLDTNGTMTLNANSSLNLWPDALVYASSQAITLEAYTGDLVVTAAGRATLATGADSSKVAVLDTSSISTATERTYLFPDASGTLALTSNITLATLGVDADLATFALPASTTISAFGATLVDDANEAAARDTLGLIAGDAGDIWVEKAGDTMTGLLTTQHALDTLDAQRYVASAAGPFILMKKSRHATPGSHTIVQNGDALGGMGFYGSDGVGFIQGAVIGAAVDGTPGVNDMPTSLVFYTTLDGASGSTERVRISNNGNVVINDTGLDADTRIEGDTDANLLVTDASTDRVGIGTASPGAKLQVEADILSRSTSAVNLTADRYAADNIGARLYLEKSRHATLGSHTVVSNGDELGGLFFLGSDGTNFENAAAIAATSSAAPGNNDMPGKMTFYTTPDGSTSLVERLSLDHAGAVVVNDTGLATDFRVESDTQASMLHVDGTNNRVGIANAAPAVALDVTGEIRASTAGTNAASVVTVGGTQTETNKTFTTPTIGSFTNATHDHTNAAGGGLLPDGSWLAGQFVLDANSGTVGSGIADYFGSTSSFSTAASTRYIFDYYCLFTKQTAGTLTWTFVNTQTHNAVWGWAHISAIAGVTPNAASTQMGFPATVTIVTAASNAFPVTGTLAITVPHFHHIRVYAHTANAGDCRLRVTNNAAGTVTPMRGSYYTVRKISGTVGSFVA